MFSSNCHEKSLSQSFHSPELQELREEFRNGIKPESCKRCWNQEAAGHKSERLKALEKFGESMSNHLEYLTPTLGNKCSRMCAQCGNTSSSSWAPYAQRLSLLPQNQFDKSQFEPVNPKLQWTADDLRYVKKVFLMMTESLNQESFPHFLSLLNQADRLDKAEIHIETSGGFMPPPEISPLLEKIEHLELSISVDACGALNNFIRHPSPWEDVKKTIQFWMNLKEKKPSWSVRIVATLSALNLTGLDDLREWCVEQDLGEPLLNHVHQPWYLSLDVLTPKQRRHLAKKNKWPKVKEELLKTRPHREDLPPQEQRLPILKHYLHFLSKLRGVTFEEVHPTLHEMLFKSIDRLSYDRPSENE